MKDLGSEKLKEVLNKDWGKWNRVKINFEDEIYKVLGQRTELKLIPETQFIYAADFPLGNELLVGCFPISIYDKSAVSLLGGVEPLPGVITLGSVIEGTIPTTIIAKKVKTGFMSHKRVFLPCHSELVDPSKGIFKIDPKKIYKERRGFANNPLVERFNEDKWLMDRIQNIPDYAYRDITLKNTISNKIDDSKKDLVTFGQVVPHKKMTLVAFQCMPEWGDWYKSKPVKLDCMVEIVKRIIEYIRNYGSFEERTGIVARPWVNAFLQVLLLHLKTHKPNLPETKKILQNFTA